jgi:hypothetical protein
MATARKIRLSVRAPTVIPVVSIQWPTEVVLMDLKIAQTLYVSEATVKTHVNRIFAKTGSRDRTQAIRYAYTHGYANPARSS